MQQYGIGQPPPERRTVQGVVVRLSEPCRDEYLVVWSPEFNHSYIFKVDIDNRIYVEADTCQWMQFDVQSRLETGPEGIQTRAFNLRPVPKAESRDPSTRGDVEYNNVHEFRPCHLFTESGKTIRFKDYFELAGPDREETWVAKAFGANAILGQFIKIARIVSTEYRDLQKYDEPKFSACVELDLVAHTDNRCPWKLSQYMFEGKEHGITGFLSKKGKMLRGPGGDPCPRDKTKVPPDTLRLAQKSQNPSKFSSNYSAYDRPTQHHLEQTQNRQYKAAVQGNTIQVGGQQSSLVAQRTSTVQPLAALDRESPKVTEIYGIVVYADEQVGSMLFSQNFSDFIRIDTSLGLYTGSWYKINFFGENPLGRKLKADEVMPRTATPPQESIVVTRFIPDRTIPMFNGHVLASLRAKVEVKDGGLLLTNQWLGRLVDWENIVADEYRKHGPFKEVVVEAIPFPNGWKVVRYHGPSTNATDLARLKDSYIPYRFIFKDEVDTYWNSAVARQDYEDHSDGAERDMALQLQHQRDLDERARADEIARQRSPRSLQDDCGIPNNYHTTAEPSTYYKPNPIVRQRADDMDAAEIARKLQRDNELLQERVRQLEIERSQSKPDVPVVEEPVVVRTTTSTLEANRLVDDSELKKRADEKRSANLERDRLFHEKVEAGKAEQRRLAEQEKFEKETAKRIIAEKAQLERDRQSSEARAHRENIDKVCKSRSYMPDVYELKSRERRNSSESDESVYWDNIEDEQTTGKDQCPIRGIIVRVFKSCVVLYTPTRDITKVVVKMGLINDSPFLNDGGVLEVGEWMDIFEVEPRVPMFGEKPPRFHYLAVTPPSKYDIYDVVPDWKQRIHHGVLEVFVTCDLEDSANIERERDGDQDFFQLQTIWGFLVLVPVARLQDILNMGSSAKCMIRFWASRVRTGELSTPLRLVATNSIEKESHDGEIEMFSGNDYIERAEENDLNSNDTNDNVKNVATVLPETSIAGKEHGNSQCDVPPTGRSTPVQDVDESRDGDIEPLLRAAAIFSTDAVQEVIRKHDLVDAYTVMETWRLQQLHLKSDSST